MPTVGNGAAKNSMSCSMARRKKPLIGLVPAITGNSRPASSKAVITETPISSPPTHTPSISGLAVSTPRITSRASATDQFPYSSATTSMSGYSDRAAIAPLRQNSAASTPAIPWSSTTLPWPPSISASCLAVSYPISGMLRLTSTVGPSPATVAIHVSTGIPAATARSTGSCKPARDDDASKMTSTPWAMASSMPLACDSVVKSHGTYSWSSTIPDCVQLVVHHRVEDRPPPIGRSLDDRRHRVRRLLGELRRVDRLRRPCGVLLREVVRQFRHLLGGRFRAGHRAGTTVGGVYRRRHAEGGNHGDQPTTPPGRSRCPHCLPLRDARHARRVHLFSSSLVSTANPCTGHGRDQHQPLDHKLPLDRDTRHDDQVSTATS